MQAAISQAILASKNDEVPVGAVIVLKGEIISRAHNQKEAKKDPTSHAEIECIKKACKKLNKKYLDDCEMYVTLEPCLMCLGAILESRIKKIYIAAKDPKGGAVVSRETYMSIKDQAKFEFTDDDYIIIKIMKEFFKSKR